MADADREGNGRRLPGRVLGRVVGSVVSPIVDNVDVDEVVERIDIDHLVERIDVDGLLDQIDVNRLLDRIDPDRLLDRVDPDRLLDRVDPNRLLDRVDPDRLLDRVDPNRLLDRVDPDRLLDRVEPDRLLDRVDPDRLLDRVDANRLLDRVDVNRLVERTEIGAIVARSTTGVFTQVLDVARTQIVQVDHVVQAVPARVLRNVRRELPPIPGFPDEPVEQAPTSASDRAVAVQGRCAGSVSRFLAFLADQFTIGVLFAMGILLVQAALEVITRSTFQIDEARWWVVATFGLWSFVYIAGSLAASGRTFGKAVLGLLVVGADGTRLGARSAAIRTLAFPLSFLLLGIGFLIGLVRRDRRELHDLIAGTAVVYAWDAETARLRAEPLSSSS